MSSSATTPALTWPTDRPTLLPLLPLVEVAWSDGVLTLNEREAFRDLLMALPLLGDEDREALRPWLDPTAPPPLNALAGLTDLIRNVDVKDEIDADSLTSFGLSLLEAADAKAANAWSAEDRAALAEAEVRLGVVGQEAARRQRTADGEVPEGSSGRLDPAGDVPTVDVEAMAEFMARPDAELRARVMEHLKNPALHFDVEIDRASHREGVLAALKVLADDELGLVGFPAAYGGADDPAGSIAVFETLGFGDLSTVIKFGVQFGLWSGSVYQLGTKHHHEKWLEKAGRLELPGCYAMTEIGHGSNVRDIETITRYDAETDELVVHTPHEGAGKEWIGNAALHGQIATVFTQLEVAGESHGVHAVVVPIRDAEGNAMPGVRTADNGPKEGLNGIDNGRIWFDQVRVPRENLLDRFASITEEGVYESPIPSAGRRFFTMLGTLVAGRISIAAASVSVAKTALAIAIRYSDQRRQFGPAAGQEVPILDYAAQQRLLLPRLATTYALHFAVRDLTTEYARLLKSGKLQAEGRQVEAAAAGLKAITSWHALETLQAARESMGGRGFHADNRLGKLKGDADIFTTFEGANVVLLQLVAKSLLTEYREEMGDLRLWDIVRFVADRAQERVAELNPVIVRKTDPAHLRDADFHQSAFEYRERRLLVSAGRRLKQRLDDGMDSFEALNDCQDHLITLARAHVDRLTLEAMQRAVARAPSAGLSDTLQTIAQLYALERLEEHRAWYLEAGYFEPAKSRAVRSEVGALCREVREIAVPLVHGFGVPDEVLRAVDLPPRQG